MPALPDFLGQLSAVARTVTLGAPVPSADNKAGEGAYDPVTEIDRAAERALRAAIEAVFPGDGIEGEEYGLVREEAPRRWLLDPVDGTRALICGLPSWTTLVALLEEGRPTHGFIDAPALDELLVGLPGVALLNGRRVRTSACTRLIEARLSTTDPYLFHGAEAEAFGRVRQRARLTRYGLDALAYARLAAGHLDLVIESGLKRHDWAALVPVVRGAGGVVGNWEGGEDLAEGALVAAATRQLFDEAIACLNE
jgi:histidinol phosphatase-like enzyme (inositol monophosphatase family)